MKRYLLGLIFGCFLSQSAHAAATSFNRSGFDISLEPIIGFESLYRAQPTPHSKYVFIYGARGTIGKRWLSAEVEYTMGDDNEAFLVPTETIHTKVQHARLGLRTIQYLSRLFDGVVRAGAQGTQIQMKTTTLTGSSTSTGKWQIRPYVGVGVEVFVTRIISLVGEATYVLNNTSVWNQNDLQLTAGVKLHL